MASVVDATFVINMDKNVKRMEDFDLMMKCARWPYERFSAVDGKNLTEEQKKFENEMISWYHWMSRAEVGCTLSHLSVWNLALERGYKRIAVFEDDARTINPGPEINDLIEEFYNFLRENKIEEPDIFYLGKCLDNCLRYKKVWHNVYETAHALCLHSYIITERGMRKILERKPFQFIIDVLPSHTARNGSIKMMTFHPSLFFQDVMGGISDLRGKASALNLTSECAIASQHIADETWPYFWVIVIGFVVAIILFCWYWVMNGGNF